MFLIIKPVIQSSAFTFNLSGKLSSCGSFLLYNVDWRQIRLPDYNLIESWETQRL